MGVGVIGLTIAVLEAAGPLRGVLAEHAGNGTIDVTFDVAEIAFIDSTGVSVSSQV